jgi:hypothetical protein
MRVLLIIAAIMVSGCDRKDDKWQIICDSGFKTPISYATYLNDGIVSWREFGSSPANKRKMLEGEICHEKRTSIK